MSQTPAFDNIANT